MDSFRDYGRAKRELAAREWQSHIKDALIGLGMKERDGGEWMDRDPQKVLVLLFPEESPALRLMLPVPVMHVRGAMLCVTSRPWLARDYGCMIVEDVLARIRKDEPHSNGPDAHRAAQAQQQAMAWIRAATSADLFVVGGTGISAFRLDLPEDDHLGGDGSLAEHVASAGHRQHDQLHRPEAAPLN